MRKVRNTGKDAVHTGPKGDIEMQIYGTTQIHGAQSISSPHSVRGTQSTDSTSSTSSITDSVEISDAANLVEMAKSAPDIRQDRVDSIRQQIANGTYETDDKINSAVENLLDEIG
jgi:negative regulator of flagellin synthesis FlgM